MENFDNAYIQEISQIEQQTFSEDLPLPKPLPRETEEEFNALTSIKVQ